MHCVELTIRIDTRRRQQKTEKESRASRSMAANTEAAPSDSPTTPTPSAAPSLEYVDELFELNSSQTGTPISTDLNVNNSPGRIRSSLWAHFRRESTDAVCVIDVNGRTCGHLLPHRYGTSNLRRHLRNQHVALAASLDVTQRRLRVVASHLQLSVIRSPETWRAALIRYLVQCDIAPSTIESEAFRDFVRHCSEECSAWLIGRDTVTDDIVTRYRAQAQALRQRLELEAPTHLSLTLDGWTRGDTSAYFAVIAHWLNDSFQPQRAVIAFEKLGDDHSASALADVVNHVLL